MCYLITFAVPEPHVSAVASTRLPRVSSHTNRFVQDLAGPGFALFSISDGGCSCGLYSSPDAIARPDRRARTLRQKSARLGWSEAKIERALSSSAEALEHKHQFTGGGLRDDIASYLAELADRVGQIKIVVHHFHGSFAEEPVTATGRVELTAGGLRLAPQSVNEDVIYTIRRSV